MADQIKEELGVEVKLIKGSRGAFEVTLGGDVLFSKNDTGRFPEAKAEVIDPLRARLQAR